MICLWELLLKGHFPHPSHHTCLLMLPSWSASLTSSSSAPFLILAHVLPACWHRPQCGINWDAGRQRIGLISLWLVPGWMKILSHMDYTDHLGNLNISKGGPWTMDARSRSHECVLGGWCEMDNTFAGVDPPWTEGWEPSGPHSGSRSVTLRLLRKKELMVPCDSHPALNMLYKLFAGFSGRPLRTPHWSPKFACLARPPPFVTLSYRPICSSPAWIGLCVSLYSHSS